jgi:hypothetical protein
MNDMPAFADLTGAALNVFPKSAMTFGAMGVLGKLTQDVLKENNITTPARDR